MAMNIVDLALKIVVFHSCYVNVDPRGGLKKNDKKLQGGLNRKPCISFFRNVVVFEKTCSHQSNGIVLSGDLLFFAIHSY